MKINKTFLVFLLCHLIIWSILPILLRANLPMDSAEALVWGMIGEWGTNKHPPLSGWLADWAWLLSGKNPFSLYILSQILVCGGLIYIYKLAKSFLSAEKSLIAAVLMEGVAYYGMLTLEYNCNVVALFLWPACTYHFYQSIKSNHLSDWLLFGLFAGLNLLNKYVAGALLLSLGLYLLFTSQGRSRLTSWKLYLSAGLAIAVVVPHFVWLYNRDFFVLDYFMGRASSGHVLPYGLGHIVYPLKFLIAQILTSATALLVLLIAYCHGNKQKVITAKADRRFVFFAGILPLLIMSLVPLLTGVKLKSMWGSPALYMLTIMWLVWFPFDASKVQKKLVVTAYGLMILFGTAYILQCLITTSPKFNLKARDFVSSVGGNNVQYVGGNVWLASIIGVYGKDNPSVIFEMREENNPWIDMKDALSKGVLVVEENLAAYNIQRDKFPKLPEAEVYNLTTDNIAGKTKEYQIYYGQISGEK